MAVSTALKSTVLSSTYWRSTMLIPLRFQRLNKLVRQPLTKGGTVVDHRDAFGLQGLYRVPSGKLSAVIVVAHHAEAGVETLFGIGVPGGDRRDRAMPASW